MNGTHIITLVIAVSPKDWADRDGRLYTPRRRSSCRSWVGVSLDSHSGEGGRDTGIVIGSHYRFVWGATRIPPVPLGCSWCHGGAPDPPE